MFADPKFWDTVFDGYAQFGRLDYMARDIDVPYHKLHRTIMRNPDLKERYLDAKESLAEMTVSEIQDITNSLERGQIDPSSAKTIINAKQWIAEKYAPVQYGPKQTIDMQVTDATQLHLEALKNQMNSRKAKDITPKKNVRRKTLQTGIESGRN